jgi:hypothetical protein
MTPYEKYYGNKLLVSHYRIFGSSAWAHIPSEKRNNLEPKIHCYTLVGYNKVFKAYRLYDPSTHKVIKHIDVSFDEVPTHGLSGSFPLLLTNDSPTYESQHF